MSDLLAAGVTAGSVSSADGVALGDSLAAAKAAFDQGNYGPAVSELQTFVARTQRIGAAELTLKGNDKPTELDLDHLVINDNAVIAKYRSDASLADRRALEKGVPSSLPS